MGNGKLETELPGFHPLDLEPVVLDCNGTLAQDGTLLEGVESALRALADFLCIHILTGDTFGSARASLAHTPWESILLPAGDPAAAKLRYVETLGAERRDRQRPQRPADADSGRPRTPPASPAPGRHPEIMRRRR